MGTWRYGIADVASLVGIRMSPSKVENVCYCPNCGRKKLAINTQKNIFRCLHASCDISGNSTELYLIAEGKEGMSIDEGRAEILERLYGFSNTRTPAEIEEAKRKMEENARKRKEEEVKQCSLRDISQRDKTYSSFLDLLTLADDHTKDLLNRGLSMETIVRRKYRTDAVSSFEEYPLKLMEEGLYVDGIPGFFRNDKNKWELLWVKRGIMIPITSHHNKIQGFQIRKDEKLLKKWYRRNANGSYALDENKQRILEKEKKYTWLSSKNLLDGTGINGFVHYACDFTLSSGGVFIPQMSYDKGIVLTEGPLKADIFFEKKKYPAIAVPGVHNQVQLSKELDFLKSIGFTTIYNGYDMDFVTNKEVYVALAKAYKLILEKGFELKRLQWNDKYKGIDDYYVAKERGFHE